MSYLRLLNLRQGNWKSVCAKARRESTLDSQFLYSRAAGMLYWPRSKSTSQLASLFSISFGYFVRFSILQPDLRYYCISLRNFYSPILFSSLLFFLGDPWVDFNRRPNREQSERERQAACPEFHDAVVGSLRCTG